MAVAGTMYARQPTTNYTVGLPREMLDELAEQVVWADSPPWEDAVSSRTNFALACHRWNDGVEANTQMWNKITIFRNSDPVYISKCFAKAKSADINLCIDCSAKYYTDPHLGRVEYSLVAFARGKLHLLSTELKDVTSLLIVTPTRADMAAVLSSCSHFVDFTKLKGLSTRITSDGGGLVHNMPWIGGATKPQVLEVTTMAPSWKPSSAFSNLKVLKLIGIDAGMEYEWSHLFSVLEACRGNLTTLQLRTVHCVNANAEHSVTLSALENFELAAQNSDWDRVLRRISMPEIVRLTIHVTQSASLSALSRSNRAMFAKAKHIRFGVPTEKMHELKMVLLLLRGVRTLDLSDCDPGVTWFLAGLVHDTDFDLSQAQAIRLRDVIHTSLAQSLIIRSAPGCVITSGSMDGRLGASVEWRPKRGVLTAREC